MKNGSRSWTPTGDSKLLYEFLPEDSSRQAYGLWEALRVLDRIPADDGMVTVLDLGCGDGASHESFSLRQRRLRWVGLDIIDSQEVISRPSKKLPFCAYDGVRIPLRDNAVDITYSRQVFEHVRHPEPLIHDVHRVLKPNGMFVGSTSHLEPFHSRSYWNYTPYGFCVLLRDAGFRSIQVRPGIDSLTLIGRRYFSYVGLASIFEAFFKLESPSNILLEAGLRMLGQPAKRRNALKLMLSGQFCFCAQK